MFEQGQGREDGTGRDGTAAAVSGWLLVMGLHTLQSSISADHSASMDACVIVLCTGSVPATRMARVW